jgi:hypothetical protein
VAAQLADEDDVVAVNHDATGVIQSVAEGVQRPFTLTFEAGDMYRARPCGEDPDDR